MDALEHNIIPLPTRKELTDIRDSDFAELIERLLDDKSEYADIGRLLLKIGKYDIQNLKICIKNMVNLWEKGRIEDFFRGNYFDHKEYGLLDVCIKYDSDKKCETSKITKVILVG